MTPVAFPPKCDTLLGAREKALVEGRRRTSGDGKRNGVEDCRVAGVDGRGSGFARRACYLGTADKAEAVFNGAARAVPRS